MKLKFENRKVRVYMREHLLKAVKNVGETSLTPSMSPSKNGLLRADPGSPKAKETKRKLSRSIVMLLMHVSSWERRDNYFATMLLSGREKCVKEHDCQKLRRVIRHILDLIDELLFSGAVDMGILTNFIDASCGAHHYFKIHTWVATAFGWGHFYPCHPKNS